MHCYEDTFQYVLVQCAFDHSLTYFEDFITPQWTTPDNPYPTDYDLELAAIRWAVMMTDHNLQAPPGGRLYVNSQCLIDTFMSAVELDESSVEE